MSADLVPFRSGPGSSHTRFEPGSEGQYITRIWGYLVWSMTTLLTKKEIA